VSNAGTSFAPEVSLTYSYDAAGCVLPILDSLGGNTTYEHDSLDRVIEMQQFGAGISEKRVDFGYTSTSRFASLSSYSDLSGTNSVASTEFQYDELDRYQQITHASGTSRSQWVSDRVQHLLGGVEELREASGR
jgi:hypothetical protein